VNPGSVRVHGAELAVFDIAGDSAGSTPLLVWAHGWGQTHAALLPLAEAMRRSAHSLLIDLPGFGASPPPPVAWGTADYADAVAEWLAAFDAPHPGPLPASGEREGPAADGEGPAPARRVWVAHSFGCRVGLQLAARHPELVDGLFLVAAPGLPPRRSLPQRARRTARRWAFRLARQVTPEGPARDRLRARFGSTDYRLASPLMRQVLVKAVNEDLGAAASAVRCPAVLVYGDQDRDAPSDIGERLHQLMPGSRLVLLRGFGHLDVVSEGRHQIAQLLREFLEQIG